MTEPTYPYKTESTYAYSNGKSYKICQDGEVLVAREYGVTLGDVRMFFNFTNTDKQGLYFAERKFKSFFWPFINPIIWWRKVK